MALLRVSEAGRKELFLDFREVAATARVYMMTGTAEGAAHHFVFGVSSEIYAGNLFGTARRFQQEGRCIEFVFQAPSKGGMQLVHPNVIALASGDSIEIQHVHVMPDYFTNMWVHRVPLPDGWIRV